LSTAFESVFDHVPSLNPIPTLPLCAFESVRIPPGVPAFAVIHGATALNVPPEETRRIALSMKALMGPAQKSAQPKRAKPVPVAQPSLDAKLAVLSTKWKVS
jgi:hypothetical protein